jgi:hypothetical protein
MEKRIMHTATDTFENLNADLIATTAKIADAALYPVSETLLQHLSEMLEHLSGMLEQLSAMQEAEGYA